MGLRLVVQFDIDIYFVVSSLKDKLKGLLFELIVSLACLILLLFEFLDLVLEFLSIVVKRNHLTFKLLSDLVHLIQSLFELVVLRLLFSQSFLICWFCVKNLFLYRSDSKDK